MKKFAFSLMALIVAVTAMANDSEYFMVGNQLEPMQSTNISVAKEILTINMLANGEADVDVYYEFQNDGPQKTITMGFEAIPPYMEERANMNGIHSDMKDFTVVMNGTKLAYKNAVTMDGIANGVKPLNTKVWKYTEERGGYYNAQLDSTARYSYVYYFDATFKPGKNIVHHTYRYTMALGVMHSYWLDYKLTPATRWANHQIDDFTLRIVAKDMFKHFAIFDDAFEGGEFKLVEGEGKIRKIYSHNKDAETDVTYDEVAMRNGMIEWHATNYSPKEELHFTSCDLVVMENQYYNFTTANGKPYDCTVFYDGGNRSTPYGAPSKDKKFTYRVYRNLPFAIRGYIFKDAKLKKFFESQWWYMPDAKCPSSTVGFSKRDLDCVNGLLTP